MMAMFENYTFTLETLSPLRIGSGEKLDSKQYYLDDDHILRLDQRKWTKLLSRKRLVDKYTNAILKGTDLHTFVQDYRRFISLSELKDAALYQAPVYRLPYDLRDRGNTPYIHLFQSDSEGNPYIPGSSLKGAIVASLLAVYYEDIFTDEQRQSFENVVHSMMESIPDKQKWKAVEAEAKKALKPMFPDLAKKHINPKNKRVIYLMQAIRVSDSDPIDRGQLAVCEKADVFPIDKRFADGTWEVSEKNPGIFHESLIPRTKVTFRLSIDEGKLKLFRKDMTANDAIKWITNALDTFRAQQDEVYTQKFVEKVNGTMNQLVQDVVSNDTDHFYFGAGVGWVNKTLTYSIFGNEPDTVGFVADFLDLQFGRNKHEDDVDLGVSPHKLKCVYYKDERHLMGHCAFSIEKTGEI